MDGMKGTSEFNLMNIGTYYNHNPTAYEQDGSKSNYSLRLVDNRIFGYATYFFPSVINFLKNHEEITERPIAFSDSKKYTTPLKVFHMTLGTLIAGVMETVYHTSSLVFLAVLTVFFVVKSLFDRDARESFPQDLKGTLKNEVSYHINGLIKGVLQAIPVAGIFLPNLYTTSIDALKPRIYALLGTEHK